MQMTSFLRLVLIGLTVSVGKMQAGSAILGWYDVYEGTAYAVLKNSDTKVQICSVIDGVSMTPFKEVVGNFSGEFEVQFVQHDGTQGLVQITDSASVSTAVYIPKVHGGSIGIANTTGAQAKFKINCVRVEIPRINGTILI